MPKKVFQIIRLLKKEYPQAKVALNFSSRLELLVAVVLSAQCTDQRVNMVTAELFKKYKTVADYAKADPKVFEKAIYSTGFYRNKARNIIAAAKLIISNFKSNVPSAMEELLTLPGVARKTANIILFDGFGKIEGIAVDTHVARLSRRLGLTGNMNPDKVEQDLIRQVDRKDWGALNHLLVTHGRQVCQAKKPLCPECCLLKICPRIGVIRFE
jgi:endonuclease-3